MSLIAGAHVLSTLEPVLLGVALLAFVRRKAYSRFPAFGAYLALRLSVCATLSLVLYAVRSGRLDQHTAYATYYYVYWIGYLAGILAALLVIQEIFSDLMETVPKVRQLAIMVFRWFTLTSVFIAIAVVAYPLNLKQSLPIAAANALMRCIGALELCLLAFIVLAMQTLRISWRGRNFGVALGLGIVAAARLFCSGYAFGHSTMATVANYCSQVVVTLAAAVWVVYFVAPEARRERLALDVSSPLARLNEVAAALAETAPPQIALGAPSPEFFLQDVERAVDRVLEKNSMRPAG